MPGDRELRTLTEWSVETRYPGNLPEATLGDAREAIEIARRVLALAEGQIRQRESEENSSPPSNEGSH